MTKAQVEKKADGGAGGIGKMVLALLTMLVAVLLAAVPAFAVERFSTETYPGTNYPLWYEDSAGLQLELCVDGPPLCLAGVPDPGQPPLVADDPANSNFPDESFWWAGDAATPLDGGGDAQLVLAREAAFGGADEGVRSGDEVSFSRVRVRATVPVAGTYRVTHPYGQRTFEDVGTGPRGINFTEDVGCALSPDPADPGCDFGDAFFGEVDPFLTWTTFGNGTDAALRDPVTGAPDAYVGNPTVEHAIKGSPTGNNFFRIERRQGAGWVTVGETDLFAIQGKVFAEAPPTLRVRDVRIVEGNSGTRNAVVNLTLSKSPTQAVSLNFATRNGTARVPGDYSSRSGTRNWGAGTTSLTRTISIPVVGDRRVEPNETFTVNLSNVVGASAPDTSARVTIVNND